MDLARIARIPQSVIAESSDQKILATLSKQLVPGGPVSSQ